MRLTDYMTPEAKARRLKAQLRAMAKERDRWMVQAMVAPLRDCPAPMPRLVRPWWVRRWFAFTRACRMTASRKEW